MLDIETAIIHSLKIDSALENELDALIEELAALHYSQIARKEELNRRREQIGKQRLALFMDRRKMNEVQQEKGPR